MMTQTVRVGIVGAGLIGGKRAAALRPGLDRLVWVADTSMERARKLADAYGARPTEDWKEVTASADVDLVIVATSNQVIVPIAVEALKQGKHVLVEKPAGRNPEELTELVRATESARGTLGAGFNHRFHPAFLKLREILATESLGKLMYIRARYGHGGRIGYDKEWRADPALGGGELLDQGVHLIDLCRWIGGEYDLKWGEVDTYFWNMPAEDNGFLLLQGRGRRDRAFLHASCTEWKNLFDFEVFTERAKIQVAGLGRSYGVEELRIYRMKPEMGPPDVEILTYPGEDRSWNLEYDAMLARMKGDLEGGKNLGTARDALRSVEIVYDAYRQSKMPWALTK